MPNLKLEFVSVLEKEKIESGNYYSQNSLFFKAKVLVDEIVPVEVLKEYAWTWKGKELRWRHELPEENIDFLIGHVHDANVEEDVLVLTAEVWGYDLRPELLEIQEFVKNGTLSISGGFKTTKNKEDEIVAMYGRELSLTPDPACTAKMGCGITKTAEILTALEKTNNDNIKKPVITMADDKVIDMLQAQIKAGEDKYDKLEKSTSSHNKLLLEQNLELDTTNKNLVERIQKSNVTIAEQVEKLEKANEKITELESNQEKLSTLEIRKAIVALEKITDEKAVTERLAELEIESSKTLESMKKGLDRALKIVTKVAKNQANKPEYANELENDDPLAGNEKSPKDFAMDMYPDYKKFNKK